MELYLMNLDNSAQFRDDLKNVELVCEVEFNGSTTFRDIHILVDISHVNYISQLITYRGLPQNILTIVRKTTCSEFLQSTGWRAIHLVMIPRLIFWLY